MPQINTRSLMALIAVVGLLAAAGCSNPNTELTFNPDSGHPSGWLPSGHKGAAQADLDSCADCHGSDFLGGFTAVSCFACHLGGESAVHPIPWGSDAETFHGSYVIANGPDGCANAFCHGEDFQGGGIGVSCDECHLTYPHPAGWDDPAGHGVPARADILDCKFCHATGIDYDGGNTGVNCQDCHNTASTGAPHPESWIFPDTFAHIDLMGESRIGDRTGCEECHDIPNQSPCSTSVCHGGGANLP